ncbi:hypothetical protein [Streptomyces sp. NPDC051567]|uniref:hypothetical protein n=1 Tax=Streptomyces sp. NPDC051567 TaxID=3365660 RepID=UPI00378E0435
MSLGELVGQPSDLRAEAGGVVVAHGGPSVGDKTPLFLEGASRTAAKLGITPVAPGTLLGVAALAAPGCLVEAEATAVLD